MDSVFKLIIFLLLFLFITQTTFCKANESLIRLNYPSGYRLFETEDARVTELVQIAFYGAPFEIPLSVAWIILNGIAQQNNKTVKQLGDHRTKREVNTSVLNHYIAHVKSQCTLIGMLHTKGVFELDPNLKQLAEYCVYAMALTWIVLESYMVDDYILGDSVTTKVTVKDIPKDLKRVQDAIFAKMKDVN